jgi:hypothetical protein
MKKRLHWSWYSAAWIFGLVAGGAFVGTVVFSLFGLIFETGRSPTELAFNGVKILGFYGFIWAPGVALVVTVKREYEARAKSHWSNPTTDKHG